MLGDEVNQVHSLRDKPAAVSGNEGRILHPASFARAVRRIDYRELRVRVRPVPLVKALHTFFDAIDIRLPRAVVTVVSEQPNLHRADTAVELIFYDFEVGIGSPSEVVNIFGMKSYRLGAVSIIVVADLHSSRADDIILRQRNLHVIGAEVGEELGHGMELVAIPLPVPPQADLGKPLSGEQESALITGARDHLGKGCFELDLELHAFARSDRSRQLHLEDRLVVRIAIVGRDELHLLGQVSHAHHFEGSHLVGSVVLRLPHVQPAGSKITVAMRFMHPRRLLLKRVQIEMKGKRVQRLTSEVVIGQRLSGFHRMLRRVVLGIDLIGHDSLRQRP